MRKIIIALAALSLAAVSCEEFEPVFTFKYEAPAALSPVTDADALNHFSVGSFTSIAQLKALYPGHGKPYLIQEPVVIRAEVVSSDESGNVYREMYLQDETGAIDFKIGRSSSYDDYKPGQILYVDCTGFTLGEYGYKSGNRYGAGLLQLGLGRTRKTDKNGKEVNADEYEVSYIDLQSVLDEHVLKGEILPEERRTQANDKLTGKDLTAIKNDIYNRNVGTLVRLNGVTYGNQYGGKEVFGLFYPDPNQNHSSEEPWNRVFLSSPMDNTSDGDFTYGVTTWALTKLRYAAMLQSGIWSDVEAGSGGTMYGPIGTSLTPAEKFGYERIYWEVMIEFASAQSISHYFMYDGVEVQVRTSGYARFADFEIPEDVRNAPHRPLDLVGILTRYQGSAQFTLLSAYYSGSSENLLSIGDNLE